MDVGHIISLLVEKGHLTEEKRSLILEDPDFKKKRKERKKKTSEERRGVYDENKCQARIWVKEGYDNIQCSFAKKEGWCVCEKHHPIEGWWLGLITESRPENPTWKSSAGDVVEHKWRTDKDGNEIKEKNPNENKGQETTEKPKKKRGRPKGSKNKKKNVSSAKELTIEEITFLLEQKQKEKEEKEDKDEEDGSQSISKNEEDTTEKQYKVDGVSYEIDDEGNIMDPEDFSPIGKPDGLGGILFDDDDAAGKHKENIEKYN
jgi:hypothetical protein